MKVTLSPRKKPLQERSRQMVDDIVKGAIRVLKEQGGRRFTTIRVAEETGISVGSLYQYFPNKDAILLALINSFEDATQEAILQALQSGKGWPLKTSLKLFVRALVGMHYRRPKLNRVLEAEEERLGGGADDFAFRPGLRDLLQEHKNEIATPVSRTTERVAMAILRAVVDQGLAFGASQPSVERQAMRAVSAFLL